jgi:hypothetical protein
MRVRVFVMRRNGRRTDRGDVSDGTPGDLRMYSQMIGNEMHQVVRLCTRTDRSSQDRELLPPLYSPALIAVGESSILLRGFQAAEGAAYVQEWRCVFEV